MRREKKRKEKKRKEKKRKEKKRKEKKRKEKKTKKNKIPTKHWLHPTSFPMIPSNKNNHNKQHKQNKTKQNKTKQNKTKQNNNNNKKKKTKPKETSAIVLIPAGLSADLLSHPITAPITALNKTLLAKSHSLGVIYKYLANLSSTQGSSLYNGFENSQ